MATTIKNLVIVESPSKAKTIGKYLGPDYEVKACMGHLRDLPKSTIGVDFERDFEPEYTPLKGKEDIIADLKRSAKKAENVFLATDPDREGEAISWHLKELLEIPDSKTLRVTFNEITKNVVTNSIQNPRAIDFDLVDAQQARRVLDRLVGYQLSPLLWKKIRKGLSAGRVQSVATRFVVDREKEIRAFVPKEYWSLTAELQRLDKSGLLTAQYYGSPKKKELHSEEEVQQILKEIAGKAFSVVSVKKSLKKRNPAPPFITSTLQQEASRKLNMTPRRTMAIAQQLYEGIDIRGEGAVGLITYMRTDSLRISDEALKAAGELIRRKYGDAYYAGSPRRFKTKGSAQDAHEAIRPSNVELLPESIQSDLTKEQYKLYKLIWDRFIASQMANAVYDTVSVEINCEQHMFHASHQSMSFAGFTAIYEEGRDEETQAQQSAIPDISEGEMLNCVGTDKQQHFTQPPARYTEATLVKAMEEQGVGRPSTYATIVSTIQDKEYVQKKDKHLEPTVLGETVNDKMMMEYFRDIIDVDFTANMEKQLDLVESGEVQWKQVLRDFYQGFRQELDGAEQGLDGKRIKVPDEETDEICELCGRNMVVKIGRFGKFLACPGFPECTNTKPIVVRMPGRCPKCGNGLLKRSGTSQKTKKQYTFYCCELSTSRRDQPALCDFSTFDVPTAEDCAVCGNTLFKKSGKGRQRTFCINPSCSAFLPEDQRGYYKKKTEDDSTGTKKPAKKSAAKKTAKKK